MIRILAIANKGKTLKRHKKQNPPLKRVLRMGKIAMKKKIILVTQY
jgi:hypothetical protein